MQGEQKYSIPLSLTKGLGGGVWRRGGCGTAWRNHQPDNKGIFSVKEDTKNDYKGVCRRWQNSEFYVLLTVHPCIISQINPNKCTILFNIFIYFSSLHDSGIHVSIIRRKLLYPCVTGTFRTVRVASGLLVGFAIQPADQTPPIQCDKHQWRMDRVISPDDGHIDARNM